MDRNREARRTTNMAAPNGLSASRRRHRSSSLRDSPDEDGAVELQESGRLRDRGVIKKDRGDRDRDRERERERSSRSKRRRENRMLIHHVTTGSNKDDGDDTSDESVNDEDEDDDDDAGNGGGLRMLPPPPSNSSTTAAAMASNHHNHNSHHQQLHHRKNFPVPSSANKVFRAAAPPPAWKAAEEMIGVSVPRKARSASTKRSHEWISGGAVVGGGGGTESIHRQSSTSPVRFGSTAASPAPVAPPSPPSSNVSVRKKMKANGGGSKPKPPKCSSKSSSSNPEELEIEIAEVLYGLMTQSQAPPKKEIPSSDATTKFDSTKSNSDTKSRVSSPISNSTVPPQNSTSLSTMAPKRKRPRQVSENPFSVRISPASSSIKAEIDHHQHHQSPKTDVSSSYLENNSPGSAVVATAENGVCPGLSSLPVHQASSAPSSEPPLPAEEEGRCGGAGSVLAKEEVEKESSPGEINVGHGNTETVIATAASTTATNLNTAISDIETKKEEKFEIDLMAPPPQLRTSPEKDADIKFSDHNQIPTQETSKNTKDKEDEKLTKSGNGKEEAVDLTEEQTKPKAATLQETGESLKQAMNEERNVELHIDLEKPNKDGVNMVSSSSNRSLHQALKHQQLSTKSARDETHPEKTAQSSSMPLPMSLANWPQMGYVAPLQGVISMDGNTMPAAPIQPVFTHPRPKRCATHCYIARNIYNLQQFMKMNPFWPAPSGSAPMFGSKPSNLNVVPSPELHGNIAAGGPLQLQSTTQDKGQAVGIFPGHKDAQRKQQVLLQQALPPVTPNNILHGPAFIFPFNQQQAVAASASVRPAKLTTSTPGASVAAANSAAAVAAVSASMTAAAPALSFNYPNMPANETQYLAILQNNPYTFPIPAAVGAPPSYRGNHHAQPMPLFNGSYYPSQMMHPSQIPPTQQISQTHQNSSGSTSSSQKHLQPQQRQQGGGAAVNGGGNASGGSLNNSYPVAHKGNRSQPPSQQQQQNPPLQARYLENEVTGGEDSPSTADSRGSRGATMTSVYGHNFTMPVHSQNFALMNPQSAISNAAASGNSNDKKQQQQSQQQQGLKRGGAESSLPPQTFAMSFTPMNGTTATMSSMAANHAVFQGLPESFRQSYHHMMSAPAVTASQQKKDFRISEEATRTTGHDSSNADDDRKSSAGLTGKSAQSIAFSRPDLTAEESRSSPAIPGASLIDSSSRNINLGANNRSTRSSISNSVAPTVSSHHLHALQQQQVLHHQKQQQNQSMNVSLNDRSKNPPSSNGTPYTDHLITSSSSMTAKYLNSPSSMTAKFLNSPSFPQNLVQTSNNSSSPAQSPQWRNSVRSSSSTTSQMPSSLASATTPSLRNLHQTIQTQQQQPSRSHSHSQSHTQISFGATSQKLPSTTSQLQQQQNHSSNTNTNSNHNQCPSPPMLVGSPSTSSISKAGGSPRTNPSVSTSGRTGQSSSLSSSQQPKNTSVGTQRSSPSILGNPSHITPSNPTKSHQQQQQLPKQTLQQQQQAQAQAQAQAHMFFTHQYMQVQQPQTQQHPGSNSTMPAGTTGYYPSRKQQQNPQSSSSSMLSLSTTTSDPAKAIAAATSNLKGGGLVSQQGVLHAGPYGATQNSNTSHQLMPAGFPQYVHNSPAAAVPVKPAEQKQPAA